jgi:CRISPR-associated protein Csm3
MKTEEKETKGFWQFNNRFIITAILKMDTPLSIGSRISLSPAASDLPVIKTPDGIPFIPGSSLKGVIRSHVERIVRTMNAAGYTYDGQKLWACDPLDEKKRCVTGKCSEDCGKCKACMVKRATKNGSFDDEAFTRELWENSCTVCRLFGSPWLASRVYFQDAKLRNSAELLLLTEVRDGVGIDRDLGTAKEGIKFDFEAVPKGAAFDIRILVENAEDWEVGLLLLALQAINQGELPLGGKTTRGLGWGSLEELKVEKVSKENLLDWLLGQPYVSVEHSVLINSFLNGLTRGGGGVA